MMKLVLSLQVAVLALTTVNSVANANGALRGANSNYILENRKLDGLPFQLPECYKKPEMIETDSSDVEMCTYHSDMVTILDQKTESVKVNITDVWTPFAGPDQLRVFVHTGTFDDVDLGFEGFVCLEDDGEEIDYEVDGVRDIQCMQAGPEEPFLAVMDVVITSPIICGSNEVPHPCMDGLIYESCSWRLVIPCEPTEMCDYKPDLETYEEEDDTNEIVVPECYEGPKMIEEDSSDVWMCHYDEEMVQIEAMEETSVTVSIENVWRPGYPPSVITVYSGTDSGDDPFQCLDEEGYDVPVLVEDKELGENSLDVQCYQAGDGEPYLAVIDVVITDPFICGSNEVVHPCKDEPILESCSWRIIVPCEPSEMCDYDGPEEIVESPSALPSSSPIASPSAAPSSSPIASPSAAPSSNPIDAPSALPSSSPIASPSAAPSSSPIDAPSTLPSSSPIDSAPVETLGEDDDKTTLDILPPMTNDCPDDVLLLTKEGVTEFRDNSVVVVSQDTTSVTIALQQMYTSPEETLDHVFYQYQQDYFDTKCYEEKDVTGNQSIEMTIQCSLTSQVALLEYWIADDIVVEGDVDIPKCCHPDFPKETPVTKYVVEIKCVSSCPEASS